ncbi:MAG: TauD/TfdA family dioxygenase [Minwuia sp.]|nr:TauD/TfdA family dioxygenase [Minwuia sp.]
MRHIDVALDTRDLLLHWPDGTSSRFPYIWLRDNDPAELHPETQERMFELLSVPETLRPIAAGITDRHLAITWPDVPDPRLLPLDWLATCQPGSVRSDPAMIAPEPWPRDFRPLQVSADAFIADQDQLKQLIALKRHGLMIVSGLAGDADSGVALGRRIGFLRPTNFGLTFDVRSKPNPNNLAYTAGALPLHTDLPNQELQPGIQFLHCVANSASGGDSIYVDGLALLNDLRHVHPDAFDVLLQTPVPFRFHDGTADIRSRQSVFDLDPLGHPSRLSINSHIMDVIDLAPDLAHRWYAGMRRLKQLLADPARQVTWHLQPGEMAVFDNRRALHGRTGFDPSSGDRHFRGFYIDHGELDSRIRVLSRIMDA